MAWTSHPGLATFPWVEIFLHFFGGGVRRGGELAPYYSVWSGKFIFSALPKKASNKSSRFFLNFFSSAVIGPVPLTARPQVQRPDVLELVSKGQGSGRVVPGIEPLALPVRPSPLFCFCCTSFITCLAPPFYRRTTQLLLSSVVCARSGCWKLAWLNLPWSTTLGEGGGQVQV